MSGSDGIQSRDQSKTDSKPRSGDRKGDAARAERLGAALRENLKRRKSQARGRVRPGAGADQGPAHDSAGIVPDKARNQT